MFYKWKREVQESLHVSESFVGKVLNCLKIIRIGTALVPSFLVL